WSDALHSRGSGARSTASVTDDRRLTTDDQRPTTTEPLEPAIRPSYAPRHAYARAPASTQYRASGHQRLVLEGAFGRLGHRSRCRLDGADRTAGGADRRRLVGVWADGDLSNPSRGGAPLRDQPRPRPDAQHFASGRERRPGRLRQDRAAG